MKFTVDTLGSVTHDKFKYFPQSTDEKHDEKSPYIFPSFVIYSTEAFFCATYVFTLCYKFLQIPFQVVSN
jgi:hypothetical protein